MFDAARGISAILVFVGHLYQNIVLLVLSNSTATRILFVLAGYSVMVFFVISGYMIGLSVYKNLCSRNFVRFDFVEFARDRLLRLYPPLLLAFAICIFISLCSRFFLGFSVWGDATNLQLLSEIQPSLVASLLFSQNMLRGIFPTPDINFPLWSLAFEFWFYVIGALAAAAIFSRKLVAVLSLCLLAFVIFAFGRWEEFVPGFVVWAAGFAGAIIRQITNFARGRLRAWLLVLLVCSGGYWIAAVLRLGNVPWLEAKYPFGMFFCLSVLAGLDWFPDIAERLSKTRGVALLASVAPFSFTLYLIHYPIVLVAGAVFGRVAGLNISTAMVTVTLTFLFVIAVSSILARVVENKTLIRQTYRALLDFARKRRPSDTLRP